MNSLRELVLILSTFLWIGSGIWIATAIVGADMTADEALAAEMKPTTSYFVFGIGVAIFALTSLFWKKKKAD